MVTRAGDRGREVRLDRLYAGDRSCSLVITRKAKLGEGWHLQEEWTGDVKTQGKDLMRGSCKSSEMIQSIS